MVDLTTGILETIDLTGNCADTYWIAILKARNLITEYRGMLVLTRQGKAALTK